MHADVKGKGRPLVFIHGFGGSSGLWAGQMEYFQVMNRVVSIDLPGHGQTSWHGETLGDMAEGLSRTLDDAGIGSDMACVAHSFGGLVALELWKKRPGIFRSLTFVGSVPRFTAVDGFPSGLSSAKIDKMRAQMDEDAGLTLDVFFRSLFTRQERESRQYALIKRMRQDVPVPSREVLNACLDILEDADLRDVLASVRVPVQFILGEADYICPGGVVEPIKRILSGVRVDVMPDCGHLPFLSRPCEVNGLLRDFLK